MWEKFSKHLVVMSQHHVFSKVITSSAIFLIAVIIIRIFDILLSRWQKNLVSKLKTIASSDISSVETKIVMVRKIITAGIYFMALVVFLLQFNAVKHIGAGLLASAGLAGIVIGMGAQNTVSNMIAGISIAFSQPIRLGDAVIFKNDFGWVEEISLMHTFIRTWDNRRIIIPNSVLSKEVVENWTINDPSLLGVVMLYLDYYADIERIKEWIREIVNSSQYSSEEKLAVVQVVDFTEKTMVLRILVKGDDAPKTWDLRCEVREKLLKKFKEQGIALPQIRLNKESVKNY